MKLQISNIRLGLATNSSSSHSIVFINNPPRDEAPDHGAGDFGWDNFTLSSPTYKRNYLAILLRDTVSEMAGPEIATAVVSQWLGQGPADGYIDHQSHFTMPVAWNGKGVDVEFFDAFKHFLLQDGVVILGGNDNSDGHPLYSEEAVAFVPRRWSSGQVARYDKKFGFWTLFNRESGAKIRLRLGTPNGAQEPIVKSSIPELIDIKITDFCTFDCEYCYQASTPVGKHADATEVVRLAEALGHAKVFEVAIGGGEPTLHPHFENILAAFKTANVVPNFTTKRTDWLRDPAKALRYFSAAGAVGISVEHASEVRQISALFEAHGYNREKVALHYVMGVHELPHFEEVLGTAKEAGLRLLLLGFKNHGRATKMESYDYSDWPKSFAKYSKDGIFGISIDTALASTSKQALAAAKVPEWMYSVKEGDFSMYIDAVERVAAPSSYCDPSLRVPMNSLTKDYGAGERIVAEVHKIFAKFPADAASTTNVPRLPKGKKRIVEI